MIPFTGRSEGLGHFRVWVYYWDLQLEDTHLDRRRSVPGLVDLHGDVAPDQAFLLHPLADLLGQVVDELRHLFLLLKPHPPVDLGRQRLAFLREGQDAGGKGATISNRSGAQTTTLAGMSLLFQALRELPNKTTKEDMLRDTNL